MPSAMAKTTKISFLNGEWCYIIDGKQIIPIDSEYAKVWPDDFKNKDLEAYEESRDDDRAQQHRDYLENERL